MVSLAGAASFWRILHEVRPGGIKSEAEQSFCVLIGGEPGSGKRTLRGALVGSRWPTDQTMPYVRIFDGEPRDSFGAGLAVYVVDATRGLFRSHWSAADRLAELGVPVVRVYNKLDLIADRAGFEAEARLLLGPQSDSLAFVEAVDAQSVKRRLAPFLLRAAPDLRLALGRRLPLLRDEAAAQVIDETARVNAELALISSIPASIPLLNIGVFGADTIIMTKNQAMMLVKLAAVYGRSVDSPVRLAAELAPVVGAAFLWRTAARSLVGLLPGFVSAVPKTLIAFVGTAVVGRIAQNYYRLGERPTRARIDLYTKEAIEAARQALPRLRFPGRGRRRQALPVPTEQA